MFKIVTLAKVVSFTFGQEFYIWARQEIDKFDARDDFEACDGFVQSGDFD